jgi:dTDP-4-amino-4,6-dideoxygalactose transaminase
LIPISRVDLGEDSIAMAVEVLRSGRLAQGAVVAEFERRFAEMTGCAHAVAVSSGTTALVASLEALQLQPGDEVITSPLTFVATLNAILEAGATAVFADVAEADFAIDPASVGAALGPRTRVLMPVHLYGQAAPMDQLMPIAQKHRLAVVEDAAQSHGATLNGKAVGSYGIGGFSFYGTKNLTTGEGGMVTTNDADLAERLQVLRNQGMRQRYEYVMAGHNYRLTDLQAALVLPQLDRYAANVSARQANAAALNQGLKGIEGLVVPQALPGRGHVWHQYTVRLTPEARLTREQFVEGLAEAGIGCGVYYPKVVFDYPVYLNHPRVQVCDVPVARRLASQVVSLPVHPALSSGDVAQIIAAVRRLLA